MGDPWVTMTHLYIYQQETHGRPMRDPWKTHGLALLTSKRPMDDPWMTNG